MVRKGQLLMGILILALLFTSCSKNEVALDINSNEESILNEISILNGTLSFRSQVEFEKFMETREDKSFQDNLRLLAENGFNPLVPKFDDLESPEINAFLENKKNRLEKGNWLYTSKSSNDDIDMEDELISDSDFASLLDSERGIIIGDRYYRYTTAGLFFTHKSKQNRLRNYLKTIGSQGKASSPFGKEPCNYYKTAIQSNDGTLSLSPVEGQITSVDEDIELYTVCVDGGTGGTGGTDGGSSGATTTSTSTPPILIPQSFGSCSYSEDSLFQQIFGHTVKCNDYHDSTHRIQTKVWNENYLIWSSVGVSAKYQKKRIIGWSESSTSDEVRLGINHAIYTYTSNVSPYNPFDPNRVVLKYKGVSYDLYGNVVPQYPINPSAWPFPEKETVGAIDIIIFGDVLYYPLTGKEANKTINKLLSQIRKNFRSITSDTDQDKLGIQIVKYLPKSYKVTQADILLIHDSQAKRTLDFNFALKFNSGSLDDPLQQFVDQANATKYDKIDIDIFGAALRNDVWKGKRILGKVE